MFRLRNLIILLVFLTAIILINNSIGNSFSILQQVKYKLPDNFKIWLKENIFVHKSYQILKSENLRLKENIQLDKKNFSEVLEKIFRLSKSDDFLKEAIIQSQDKISQNYKAIREDIIENYILPKKITSFVDIKKNIPPGYWKNKPEGDFNVYKVTYYNMSHIGILEKNKGNKKLIIYNQGHNNNPYNHQYFIDLKNYYKNNGYDILSLSMTNLGYNLNTSNKKDKINFPGLKEPIIHLSHEDYKNFYDPMYPNLKGLSLMLSGNYYLIKELIGNYNDVVMIGVSGGGWYTVLLSSIITEIKQSYSFSGTLPILLRMFGSAGDWEQIDSKIYDEYSYLDFYFLDVIDNFGEFSRVHYEVYSKNDTTFTFNDPAASLFFNIKEETSTTENFKIFLLDSDKHEVNLQLLKKTLN